MICGFFWLYSGTVDSLAMAISACLSQAKVAAACEGVAFRAFHLPYMLDNKYNETAKLGYNCAVCLLSPT